LDSILAVANFALHLDFGQSAHNAFGVSMAARKAKGVPNGNTEQSS
jgi:hypothetical protein